MYHRDCQVQSISCSLVLVVILDHQKNEREDGKQGSGDPLSPRKLGQKS